MSKDNDNKIHTVYIDGVPCHWQVMQSVRQDGFKLVCVRIVNCNVEMNEADKAKYKKVVDVDYDLEVPYDDPIVKGFKDRFGLDDKEMCSILAIAKHSGEQRAAYKLLAELEKEDGYVCD